MSRPPPTMIRCALNLPAPTISATITSHRIVRFMDSPSRSGEKSPETAVTTWEIPPAKSIKRVRRTAPDPENRTSLRLVPERQADPRPNGELRRRPLAGVLERLADERLKTDGARLEGHAGSDTTVQSELGNTPAPSSNAEHVQASAGGEIHSLLIGP